MLFTIIIVIIIIISFYHVSAYYCSIAFWNSMETA